MHGPRSLTPRPEGPPTTARPPCTCLPRGLRRGSWERQKPKALGVHKHLRVPAGVACLTSKVLREISEGREGGQAQPTGGNLKTEAPPGLGEPHAAAPPAMSRWGEGCRWSSGFHGDWGVI